MKGRKRSPSSYSKRWCLSRSRCAGTTCAFCKRRKRSSAGSTGRHHAYPSDSRFRPVHLTDPWTSGDSYEPYVGRWSRLLAPRFLGWAGVGRGRVMDVGCGTGALSEALLRAGAEKVLGIDTSKAYVEHATRHLGSGEQRAEFKVGDARALPADGSWDGAVSGLVLNFVPDPGKAVSEMRRVVKPGGTVAAYVWDYAGKMELMRYFWDAACDLDADARTLDEAVRFPICEPGALRSVFEGAGLLGVVTSHVDQPTVFRDFDDYWKPFLGGQAPAPGYCMGLDEVRRGKLRELIRDRLPTRADGTIPLIARAWTVKGMR
ncbi:MAG: class I SAM-dependent methyltransferase [Euryarchaeota archaeon]|nr:class I SAM-dependent methyltransferase [Euryarchaeota archaeon]